MDAKALTPRDLFDGKVTYEIPPFQRPYVWTEGDQWQPLWDDIARVTEAVLEGPDGPGDATAKTHFLGAVVLKLLSSAPGDPQRYSVIDGQQRLTTLQLLLDAAHHVLSFYGDEDDAETIEELVLNSSARFAGTPKRFKLWPSRSDRQAFEHAMDDHVAPTPELAEARIVAAHKFFVDAVQEWAEVAGDAEKRIARLATLAGVLESHLQLVAIGLSGTDDDQLIFETLNDRGTPLLAADLIKNYVFQRCEELGVDVDAWSEKYWQDFDEDLWRGQVSQGRLYRSKIDLFLQYWLTMRLRDEIPTDAVFSRFRKYAAERLSDPAAAEEFLSQLRRDADTFRDLDLDASSTRGRFYDRVVVSLELGAVIPLLLWLVSDNHAVPEQQIEKALAAVESWVVRRTLLRRTMKNVNKLVVALLKELDSSTTDEVGDVTVKYLASQTADAQEWPTDQEVLAELPRVRAYGNIKQQRLRTVLAAIEQHARTQRHENVSLPDRLDIEHVMPRGWRSHWGADVLGDPEAERRRDQLIHTIGNLTLVTAKLNSALSNRPWTDAEAAVVAPTGKDAGLGKRSLLSRFSILLLNKDIVDNHLSAWSEDDIEARADNLASAVTEIWPRPQRENTPPE